MDNSAENVATISTVNNNVVSYEDQEILRKLHHNSESEMPRCNMYKGGILINTSILQDEEMKQYNAKNLYDRGFSPEFIALLTEAANNGSYYLDCGSAYKNTTIVTVPMMDLSTEHLRPQDIKNLESLEFNGKGTVINFEYGYTIDVNAIDLMRSNGLSDEALKIMRDAKDAGVKYVNFDRDADSLAGYPTFDSFTGRMNSIEEEELSKDDSPEVAAPAPRM